MPRATLLVYNSGVVVSCGNACFRWGYAARDALFQNLFHRKSERKSSRGDIPVDLQEKTKMG